MRKLAAFILVLAILAGTLCGCSTSFLKTHLKPQTIRSDDLTITLPGHFVDWSSKDFARGLPFVYGFQDAAVMGLKEPRDLLDDYMGQSGAAAYAELFLQVNHTDVPVTEEDGLVLFRYTAASGGVDITYLCAAYMGPSNYWIIQTYCATEDFADFEDDFMDILQSVQL